MKQCYVYYIGADRKERIKKEEVISYIRLVSDMTSEQIKAKLNNSSSVNPIKIYSNEYWME